MQRPGDQQRKQSYLSCFKAVFAVFWFHCGHRMSALWVICPPASEATDPRLPSPTWNRASGGRRPRWLLRQSKLLSQEKLTLSQVALHKEGAKDWCFFFVSFCVFTTCSFPLHFLLSGFRDLVESQTNGSRKRCKPWVRGKRSRATLSWSPAWSLILRLFVLAGLQCITNCIVISSFRCFRLKCFTTARSISWGLARM